MVFVQNSSKLQTTFQIEASVRIYIQPSWSIQEYLSGFTSYLNFHLGDSLMILYNVIFYVHSMYYSDYRMDTTRFLWSIVYPVCPAFWISTPEQAGMQLLRANFVASIPATSLWMRFGPTMTGVTVGRIPTLDWYIYINILYVYIMLMNRQPTTIHHQESKSSVGWCMLNCSMQPETHGQHFRFHACHLAA